MSALTTQPVTSGPGDGAPAVRRIAVVGAGIIGLSTAWFLQQRDAQVTVFERGAVGGGASDGSAGWLSPGLAAPLPEPAVLRYGLRAALRPSSPVYVPLRPSLRLLRFLAGMTRHCTQRHWRRGLEALAPLSRRALHAFDEMADGGVAADMVEADPLLICYRTAPERDGLVEELEQISQSGTPVPFDLLSGDEARAASPAISDAVGAALRVRGQRFTDPARLTQSLADSVRRRGSELHEEEGVIELRDGGAGIAVATTAGRLQRFDAVVLACGAWLGELARRFKVRAVVQAGRGYSFSAAAEQPPAGPLYFPAHRVTCTPLPGRLRVSGMMEFRRPDAPLDPRRIAAIVDSARPLLRGVDLDDRADEWVGSRPCTVDGLPLIGGTSSPRVFVAGGHGMWGLTLGPITGRLLAAQIAGDAAPELAPFSPLR